MFEKIVQLNEEVIKGQLKELIRGSAEETRNEMLEDEEKKLMQAAQHWCNELQQGFCSGHYSHNLTTTSGDITLREQKQRGFLLRMLSSSGVVGREAT